MADPPDKPDNFANLLPAAPDTPEQRAAYWTRPGIYIAGDDVIWDGEAEALGVPPLTKYPAPPGFFDDDYWDKVLGPTEPAN